MTFRGLGSPAPILNYIFSSADPSNKGQDFLKRCDQPQRVTNSELPWFNCNQRATTSTRCCHPRYRIPPFGWPRLKWHKSIHGPWGAIYHMVVPGSVSLQTLHERHTSHWQHTVAKSIMVSSIGILHGPTAQNPIRMLIQPTVLYYECVSQWCQGPSVNIISYHFIIVHHEDVITYMISTWEEWFF